MRRNDVDIEKRPESSPRETALSVFKTVVVTTAVIAIVALALSILHIGCPIKFFTGLSCPGCGMFRAWTSFLTLHPLEAFAYHPLFWCVPIALVAAAILQEGKWKRACTVIIVVLLVLLCALWVARLLIYPDMELILGASESLQYPADVVGWSIPRWIEAIFGLLQA